MATKKLSIVIPIFNEAPGIKSFLDDKLLPVLAQLPLNLELILVNDGSTDSTLERLRETKLFSKHSPKLISFTRNFGKEVALAAGLRYATGDACLMLDSDGQHPVEAIPSMLKLWESSAPIITAVAKNKNTDHKLGSRLFYFILRLLGNKAIRPGTMDFRLIDRVVIDEFNQFSEHNRITRGLIDWLGFPQTYLEVKTHGRTSGRSTYSFRKLTNLALDTFISTSRAPLRIFGIIGLLITLVSGLLGLFILIEEYILADPLGLDWAGAVAVSVFVAFLVGLVLISQSVTALYISQIHDEAKSRPLFVIDHKNSRGI